MKLKDSIPNLSNITNVFDKNKQGIGGNLMMNVARAGAGIQMITDLRDENKPKEELGMSNVLKKGAAGAYVGSFGGIAGAVGGAVVGAGLGLYQNIKGGIYKSEGMTNNSSNSNIVNNNQNIVIQAADKPQEVKSALEKLFKNYKQ